MAQFAIKPEDPVLTMHYPGFVFRTLRSDGIDANALLDGTGLTDSLLCDPDFRCDYGKIRRFYSNAIELTADPHIGVRLAQRFRASYVGLPFLTAASAESFEVALTTLSQLLALTFPGLKFDGPRRFGAEYPAECAFDIFPKWPLGDIAYFGTSSALAVCDCLFRALLQVPEVSLRAEIALEQPDGWDEVACELAFPVRFATSHNRLIFPAALLDAPLPASDPINYRKLRRVCDQIAGQVEPSDTLVEQLLVFLKDSRNLSSSIERAADQLGYSQRSLRRQLARNSTSLRELVRQAREQMARERLSNPALPVQKIAFELGFDTPSNFTRSFKVWTGATPTEYRTRQLNRTKGGQN